MGLLDMAFGAMGVQNPLNYGTQAQANPNTIAAQMGGMDPNSPQYQQLQQQMQTAQQQENQRARAQGLIGAASSMLSARDPRNGRPAGFGYAAGQGLSGYEKADEAEIERENAQAAAQTQAMQAGSQMAAQRQQMQMGGQQMQLQQQKINDGKYLASLFGVSTPDAVALVAAKQTAAGQLAAVQKILNDPKASPELKQRAQMAMPGLQAGQANEKLGAELLGAPISAAEQKYIGAETNAANAHAGYYGAATTNMAQDRAMQMVATGVNNEVKNILANRTQIEKEVGAANGTPDMAMTQDWLMDQEAARQGLGEWPSYLPPPGTYPPNTVVRDKANGIKMLWNGRNYIPLTNAPSTAMRAADVTEPTPETPPDVGYSPTPSAP